MNSRREKLATLVGVFAAVTMAVFVAWFHWNRLRPLIAWGSEKFAGFRVEITGPLGVEVGGRTRVTADGIAVFDRRQLGDARTTLPFVAVDHVEFVWNVMALRQPSLKIQHLLVQRGELHLDRMTEHAPAASAAPSGKSHSNPLPAWLESGEVLDFRTLQGDEVLLSVAEAHLDAEGAAKPTTVKLTGHALGEVLTLEARLPSQASLLGDSGRDMAVEADGAFGKMRAHVRGEVAFSPFKARAQTKLEGTSLAETMAKFGYLMSADIPHYDVRGAVSTFGDIITIDGLNALIGESRGDGALKIAFNSPLDVSGKLHFAHLRFADLGAFSPKPMTSELPAKKLEAARHQVASDKLYSDAKISTGWLDGPRVDLAAVVDQFEGDGKASLLKAFDLTVKLGHGQLQTNIARGRVMHGDVAAALTLMAVPDGLKFSLNGHGENVRTGRVLAEFIGEKANKKLGKLSMDELVEGSMNFFVDVSGRGASLSEIMAHLDGPAGIAIGKGKASAAVMEALGLDATELVGVLLAKQQRVTMDCGIVGARVKNGEMTLEPVFVGTSDSDVVAEGKVDLTNEKLNLTIKTYPKDPSIGALRLPIYIKGTLIDPKVSVGKRELAGRVVLGIALGFIHPVAATLALIEPGNAPKRTCAEYSEKLARLRAE